MSGSCEWVGAADPECAEDHTVVNEDEAGEESNVPAGVIDNDSGAAAATDSGDKKDGLDEDDRQSRSIGGDDEDEEDEEDLAEISPRSIGGDLTHRRNQGGDTDELEDHLTPRRRRGDTDDAPEQALFADTANSTQRNKGFPGAWSVMLIGIVAVLAVRSWHRHKGAKANSKPSQMSDYGAVSLV